jgi:hypothetical protein
LIFIKPAKLTRDEARRIAANIATKDADGGGGLDLVALLTRRTSN